MPAALGVGREEEWQNFKSSVCIIFTSVFSKIPLPSTQVQLLGIFGFFFLTFSGE